MHRDRRPVRAVSAKVVCLTLRTRGCWSSCRRCEPIIVLCGDTSVNASRFRKRAIEGWRNRKVRHRACALRMCGVGATAGSRFERTTEGGSPPLPPARLTNRPSRGGVDVCAWRNDARAVHDRGSSRTSAARSARDAGAWNAKGAPQGALRAERRQVAVSCGGGGAPAGRRWRRARRRAGPSAGPSHPARARTRHPPPRGR